MREISFLSVGNFFATIHFFLIIYILAPYLATFMPANGTGLTISLGAIVTLCLFPFIPRMAARHSPQRLALFFAIIEGFALFLLSTSPTPLAAILFVVVACAVPPLIAYQLDLMLEATVREEGSTGRIRTLFLSAQDVGLVAAPIIIGLLLDHTSEYSRVFLVAALTLIPFVLLMLGRKFPRGKEPNSVSLGSALACMVSNKDTRSVTLANAVLQFFFHLAPLYIPLYLHTYLGISWTVLGWLLAVSLIPFLAFEYPAGWLADKWLGDKELMVLGFILMGVTFGAVSLITATTPVWWIGALLFGTRVGAVLCEATIEGHFFRSVSETDTNTISIYRMMRPVGALMAPLLGSILLSIASYGTLFWVTGLFIFVAGSAAALSIRDIR